MLQYEKEFTTPKSDRNFTYLVVTVTHSKKKEIICNVNFHYLYRTCSMSKIKTAEMASDIMAILLNFEEQLFSRAATRDVNKKRWS